MKKVYGFMIKGALVVSLLVPCLPITTVTYAKDKDIVGASHLESYSLQINSYGKLQTVQTQGFIQDGVRMIAAADVFNNIGFHITAVGASKNTFVVEANEIIPRTIFNKFTFKKDDSIRLFIGAGEDEIEDEDDLGEYVRMPTYITFINGRLYIPLEFITTILNYDVKYDYTKNIIAIAPCDSKEEQVKQIEDFVHRYMNDASEGYSSDLSLYTPAFLEHDDDLIDTAFSDEQWPEPHLVLKDWTIRYLFFISHDEAMVKIPYLAMGKVSKRVGGVWLRIIRTDNEWKVDTSTAWNQSFYIDGIKEQINNLKINEPQTVKAIKRGLYSAFNTANANKKTVEGAKAEYKTFPKNITVLYADDQIAYVYTEYNWSFKSNNENLDTYPIVSNKDFITMQKNSKGHWEFKTHYGLPLDYNMPTSLIRGNYDYDKYTFMAFDDYYLHRT